MNKDHQDVIATLSSLIEACKISGAASFVQIEAAILEASTTSKDNLGEDLQAAVRAYLDARYQVVTSDNEAKTIVWRIR